MGNGVQPRLHSKIKIELKESQNQKQTKQETLLHAAVVSLGIIKKERPTERSG